MIKRNFIIGLLVVLVLMIIFEYNTNNNENFLNLNLNQQFQQVDWSKKEQDCNELTKSSDCVVKTVVPTIKQVCSESNPFIPEISKQLDNNYEFKPKHKIKIESESESEFKSKSKPKSNEKLSLDENYDLLSNFNNSQINNIGDLNILDENLSVEIKSLNSLENDLLSEM